MPVVAAVRAAAACWNWIRTILNGRGGLESSVRCSAREKLLPICSLQAGMVGRYFSRCHVLCARRWNRFFQRQVRLGVAQSLARELWPRGIHVAHIVLDGGFADLSVGPAANDELDPDAMATAYWQVACQERNAWTLELDLRPYQEKFFE